MKVSNGVLKCGSCDEVLDIARCVPEAEQERIQDECIFFPKPCPIGCKTLSVDPNKNRNIKLVWVEIDPRLVT